MPNMRFARVMGHLLNVPLFAHPRTAVTVYNALSGRFGTAEAALPETIDAALIDGRWQAPRGDVKPQSSRFVGERVRNGNGDFPAVEPFLRTKDGIGVISIDGELVNRGAWVGSNSGTVSYEGVKFQLTRAAQDPNTKAVLLDINSPGGEAIGADEVATLVRAVREVKPVYAIANGMAASAAYMIASGATKIFTAPSGLVGSIGCVLLHMDMSGALADAGIKPTLIFAGDHKVDGNFTEALPDDVKAQLQAEVNSFYSLFLDSVAAGRGRRLSAKGARDTQARTYIGQQAVEIGVADAVGTFDDVLAETTSKLRRSSRSQPSSTRNQSMSKLGIDDTQEQDQAATVSAAEARGHARGLEEGTRAGATAANARIAAVLADERVKGRELHAVRLASASADMSADAVAAFCATLPAEAAAPAAAASTTPSIASRAAETGVAGVTAGQGGSPSGGAVGAEEAAGMSWDSHIKPVVDQRQSARR